MTCNVGGVERPIRIVLGIALLGIGAFAGLPPMGTGVALVVGTIMLVTGAIGFCPAWTLLGINTLSDEEGIRSGVSEPYDERVTLKVLGIAKLEKPA